MMVPPIDPYLDDPIGSKVLHMPRHGRARERECVCKLCPCHTRSVPEKSDDLTRGFSPQIMKEALDERRVHAPVLKIPGHPGEGEDRDLSGPDEGEEVIAESVPVDSRHPLQAYDIDAGMFHNRRVYPIPSFVFKHILSSDPAISQEHEKGKGNPRP